MKTLKLLSMLVFCLCLVSTASAIVFNEKWEDGSQAISITEGDSATFILSGFSISDSSVEITIRLYDTQSNLVTFEDNIAISNSPCENQDGSFDYDTTCFYQAYTFDENDYQTPGDYRVHVIGYDSGGSFSPQYPLTLTINEIQDTNIPVITLLGDNPVTVVQDTTYTDAGATAYDQEDGDITANIIVASNVDTDTLGTYLIKYNVQDNAGNHAAQVTRTVSVVEDTSDTTAPVITLLGNAIENVALGDSYTDAGATALDDVDGDITASIVVVNPVDTNTIGVYTITYNVQDNAGNSAVEVTRTVNVFDPNDTTEPTITVITPEQDKEYDDSELTFEVEVDEIAEVTFSLNGGSETTMDYQGISNGILTFVYDIELNDGDHEVTFYATDAAGNTANVIVEFSIDTSTSDKNNGKTTTNYYQSNYEEQLYLDQFKPKKIIYLEADDQPEKVLNWWQKFVAWLAKIFGF